MDDQFKEKRIRELSARLAELEKENDKLKVTQHKLAEINNNYLMLHYLTKNINECQTTTELWDTYLRNLSHSGFNYTDTAIMLPDEQDDFTVKLTLVDGATEHFTCEQTKEEYIIEAITAKKASTSSDHLKAAVPIINKVGVIRAILLLNRAKGICADDLQLLDVYIQQTAATIENLMLTENLRQFQALLGRQLDQFVMLHYVTKAIHDASNYYAVLESYLTTLCSDIGFSFQRGVLYLIDDNNYQKAELVGGRLSVSEVENFEGELTKKAVLKKKYQISSERCHLAMPLNSFGQVNAVIEIVHNDQITPEQIQMLEIFAMQTASALDNARLKLHLEYLSFHDPLTSIHNRAFFEKVIRRIETENLYPVGVIVCDLDGLKMVNDILGHQYGDKYLAAAAQLIKRQTPPEAVVARIGGDEFGILIPDTKVGTAEEIGLRLKQAVRDYNSNPPGRPLGISVGWAESILAIDVAELLRQADENMYLDKKENGPASRDHIVKALQGNEGYN